jgi:alcohol dehydrogenase YqhD (iron-dependent ADH family)
LAIIFFLERSAAKLWGVGEIRKMAKRIRTDVRRVIASRNSGEVRRLGAEKIITKLLKMVFSGLL